MATLFDQRPSAAEPTWQDSFFIREIHVIRGSFLEHKLADEQAMLTKLKFSHAVSQIENPMTIRKSRRTIARLLTELNARSNKSNK